MCQCIKIKFSLIEIVFAHRDKMDQTQDQLLKYSPLDYITIITHIHMEQNMHINVCVPVTIKRTTTI